MPYKDPATAKAHARAWYAKNKERIQATRPKYSEMSPKKRAYHRKKSREFYRKLPPDERVSRHLMSNYGITIDDKRRMLVEQNHACAICGVSFDKESDAHVDHDHSKDRLFNFRQRRASGRGYRRKPKGACRRDAVRGLLCLKCNNGLGSFDDSIEHLENAARYLKARTK